MGGTEHCRPGMADLKGQGWGGAGRLCTQKCNGRSGGNWKGKLTSTTGTGGQLGALCLCCQSQGCFLTVHESFPVGSVLQPLLCSGSSGLCV